MKSKIKIEPTTEFLTVKVNKSLSKRINKAAFDSGHSRSSWSRHTIEMALKKLESKLKKLESK